MKPDRRTRAGSGRRPFVARGGGIVAALVVVAGCAASCGTQSPPAPLTPAVAGADRAGVASADSADRIVASRADPDGPGGAVVVVQDGRVVYTAAWGLADVEHGVPVTESTVFDLASVTKQFTAYAAALAESRGLLDLDAPVRRYVPDFPAFTDAGRAITVRHLIHHTSGLKDYSGLLALAGWRGEDLLTGDDVWNVVRRQQQLHFEPGAMHRYSNTGYAVLVRVVEAAVGVPLDAYLEAELFEPLGMDRTRFRTSVHTVIPDGAQPYAPEHGGLRRMDWNSTAVGAGGLQSTVADMAQWLATLMDGRVGGPVATDSMRRVGVLNDGTELTYAFGLGSGEVRGVKRWGHGGQGPGWGSTLDLFPEHGLGIVAVTNNGGANVSALSREIAAAFLGDEMDDDGGTGLPPGAFMVTREPLPRPERTLGVEADTARFDGMAGRYQLEEGGDMSIERQADGLFLRLRADGPAAQIYPLPNGRWLFPPARWELSFPARGGETGIVLHLVPGSAHRGPDRDVPGRAIEIPPLSAGRLAEYAGTYWSDELQTFYQVESEDGALVLVHPRHGRILLAHDRDDTFYTSVRTVARATFVRQVEIDLTSPVVGVELEAYAWGADGRFRKVEVW